MQAPSPARLYAAAVGALLVVLGLVGFFYSASFGGLTRYEDALGGMQVNAWINLFYLGIGGVGVLVAGVSSRSYALVTGVLFTVLALVGWGSGALHLVLGLLGLAAVAGTPEAKRSKPRAKPARQRA